MSFTIDSEKDILYLEVPLAICVCVIYVFASIGIHYYKSAYGHNPWIHEVSFIDCDFNFLIIHANICAECNIMLIWSAHWWTD